MSRYRRRRGGYGGYRRRRNPKVILKIIAVLFVVAACAAAVVQTRRLADAQDQLEALQKQAASSQQDQEGGAEPEADGDKPLAYQTLYPEMQAGSDGTFDEDNPKAVYLTFEDGPSSNTGAILDALAERGQKATFFVVGKNIAGREETLQRIVDEGHTIGLHGYSHDYAATYTSADAFLEDFHEAYQAVYEACGVYPEVFRFPGGSVNAYNRGVYQQLIAEMLRRGFVYYDWNVSGGDEGASAEEICAAVIRGVRENEHPVVLLHDASSADGTAQAVPAILDEVSGLGYYCDKLTPAVRPITFSYSE